MKLAFLALVPLMAAGPDMVSLSWMSGCWAFERNGARVEEHWSRPAGDLMLGYSRTMRPGRPVFFEQLRIELKDGDLTFIPLVGKQGPIPFTLKKSGANVVVFENATHDYPQRIAYERIGDELKAKTELLDTANPRTQAFNYKRVSCD